MGKIIEIVGKKYGRLMAVERNGFNKNKRSVWFCKCDCGNIVSVDISSLRNGSTKSCGCLNKELRSLPKYEAFFNRVFERMKRGAKDRNYEWRLTKEEVKILTKQNCYYCDVEPKNRSSYLYPNGKYDYNGLDRVDNSKGYTLDNVVPCCKICNRSKDIMTKEDFIDHCRKIINHIGKK